jgi:acylglycerol kinase
MREFCLEAKALGDQKTVSERLKKATIILNPAASKRESEEKFEKFCAPILNLGNFKYLPMKYASK